MEEGVNGEIDPEIVNAFYKLELMFESHIKLTRTSGGLTNKVYLVDFPNDKRYIIRVFGKNTDAFLNRFLEFRIIKELEEFRLSPRVWVLTSKGSIESYIDGRVLTRSDFSEDHTLRMIGKTLRKLHAASILTPSERSTACLWTMFRRWIVECTKLYATNTRIASIVHQIHLIVEALEKRTTTDSQRSYPIVLCHNDLNPNNMLYVEKDDAVKLIDFEYASYNYRGFDIANMFVELAGNECDLEHLPTSHARYRFYRHYLKNDDKQAMAQLDLEVIHFMPCCFLLWGLWGLIQYQHADNNDFDYLTYSQNKINGYTRCKQCFKNGSIKCAPMNKEIKVETVIVEKN